MFLSIKPNTVIFDLISTFIIKFEFSSCCVICIHICNCTFSNECSTGNSLSFKLNNPNSSSLWNSFNFYIIGLDQIWILFICLISIRMSWLQIRQILSFINLISILAKMFFQIQFVNLNMNTIDVFNFYFQSYFILNLPFSFVAI